MPITPTEAQHRLALAPSAAIAGRIRLSRCLSAASPYSITYLGTDDDDTVCLVKEFFPRAFVHRAADGVTVEAHSTEDGREFVRSLRRFVNEGGALADIDHPAVVRARELVEENGTAYLVMTRETGASLEAYLAARGGRLSALDATRFAARLAAGLERLHADGVVHRDLGPQSLIVRDDGHPVIVSFSARRHLGERSSELMAGYAAFEQYRGREVGPWTDVYAVAALLYRTLVGAAPPSALDRAAGEALAPLATVAPDASAALITTMTSALSLLPPERPHSAGALRRQLESGVAEGAATAPTPVIQSAPPAPPASPAPAISAAAARDLALLHDLARGQDGLEEEAALQLSNGGIIVPNEERAGTRLFKAIGDAALKLRARPRAAVSRAADSRAATIAAVEAAVAAARIAPSAPPPIAAAPITVAPITVAPIAAAPITVSPIAAAPITVSPIAAAPTAVAADEVPPPHVAVAAAPAPAYAPAPSHTMPAVVAETGPAIVAESVISAQAPVVTARTLPAAAPATVVDVAEVETSMSNLVALGIETSAPLVAANATASAPATAVARFDPELLAVIDLSSQHELARRTERRRRTAMASAALGVVAVSGVAFAVLSRTPATGAAQVANGESAPPSPRAGAVAAPAAPIVTQQSEGRVAALATDSARTRESHAVREPEPTRRTESRESSSAHEAARRSESSPTPAITAPTITLNLPSAPEVRIVPAELIADLKARVSASNDLVDQGEYAAARRSYRATMASLDSAAARYTGSAAIQSLHQAVEQADERARRACAAENELHRKRNEPQESCQ